MDALLIQLACAGPPPSVPALDRRRTEWMSHALADQGMTAIQEEIHQETGGVVSRLQPLYTTAIIAPKNPEEERHARHHLPQVQSHKRIGR